MADIQLIKVSQLPIAETLEGLSILGIDTTNNRSVQALMSLLKGLDGKPVEIQKSATHLQWRVQGESTWINLVTLDELKVKGDTGANIELQATATHIQWRVVDGTWADLVALSELKGGKGDPGANIELQKTATHIQWRVVDGTWANLIALSELKGDTGKTPAIGAITAQSVTSGQNPTFTLTNSGNVDAQGNPIYTGELKIPAGAEGKNLELQKTSTHVQWRVVGGTWANLIPLSDLKGAQGDNISLQKTATHIQWRLGTGAWTNLVALTELKGDTGANIELQKSATHVQWRVQGTSTWNNLILIDDLKVKGDTGANIELQKSITHVQWRAVGSSTWTNLITLSELKVKGDPGENIELQKTSTHVQWRVVGGSWANLISLSDLKGDTGASVELQVTATYIQWRVQGTSTWINLIAIADLKGAQGNNIELQKTATYIQWRVVGGSWANLVALADLKGDQGQGLPTGGSAGQQLVKKSATDYDYDWETPAGAGDMLKSVYDPSGKNGDAFSQDNMKDGTNNKNFTQTDRDNIAEKYVKPGTGIPKADLAAEVQTSLGKADTALQSFTETDPTVPSWAKAASKPSYSYTEITGTKPPTDAQKNSDITKAEIEAKLTGSITSHTHVETDPTVPSWAKQTNKPSYTATEVGAIPSTQKGSASGVAELDASGKVLSSQLPSYVDDVLNYTTQSNFPVTGESGKIYITEDTNKTYRWTGSAYVEISPSIALGETSSTAYRGDRGKIAYDHSQSTHAPSNAQKNSDITKAEIEAKLTGAITTHSHTVTKANVGLGNVDNTSDANKPVSTAQQSALDGKLDTSSFVGSTFTANVIPLDNPLGSFRVATASNATTYTLSTTKVIGAWAKILVNAATEPAVTGGTLIKGSDFEPSANMYLYVSYDGTKTEYYFAEI